MSKKIGEVSIELHPHLTVSKEMASRCLLILEWFLDDNPNTKICHSKDEDGKTFLFFDEKASEVNNGPV